MENLYTIDTFEDAGREINSPRSLEACLRIGVEPSELTPRTLKSFAKKGLRDDMVQTLYDTFERKRKEKISMVSAERDQLIKFRLRSVDHSTSNEIHPLEHTNSPDKVSAMLELEKKRMEAVKRRQEKELTKILSKEETMVELQQKLQKAEEEEVKKKKEHDKKVKEQKAIAEKKHAQRLNERAQKEREELEAAKVLQRKETDFERKKREMEEDRRRKLQKEALERDQERTRKMEEHRLKTEALIDAQFQLAEKNRQIMLEREAKVMAQLNDKKQRKAQEIIEKREKAKHRIDDALNKHHVLHEEKERLFHEREEAAMKRANVVEQERLQRIKNEADDRDRSNRLRMQRLQDAARLRKQHRDDVVQRRMEKDKTYDTICAQQGEETMQRKFYNQIRQQDKLDNVQRVNRMNEFHRLQTLKSILDADQRYERIQTEKLELLRRHREEVKHSLCRKHEIANAMDIMRETNDSSLLDQLFKDKKGKKKKQKNEDLGDTVGDDRLLQTA
jgi:hypothetical protein